MRGAMTFRYFVLPLAGKPDRTQLCELGQRIAAGLRAVQLQRADQEIFQTSKTLPPTAGFLRLEGAVVLTSSRQVGAAMEVRLFNPDTKTVTATLQFTGKTAGAKPPTKAEHVDFEGNRIAELGMANGKCKVALKPKQIFTLRLS